MNIQSMMPVQYTARTLLHGGDDIHALSLTACYFDIMAILLLVL